MTKTCSKCGEDKLLNCFYRKKNGAYEARCKPCRKQQIIDWQIENKDKVSDTKKRYYQENRRNIIRRCMTYADKRYKGDECFRIVQNLRTRMRLALNNSNKADTTQNLLGCTTEELKAHLESQFTDGMSWDNYGMNGWHIDHIIPCSSFDMLDPEEQRECFHYTNLQPLWAEDNLRKSDKIETK